MPILLPGPTGPVKPYLQMRRPLSPSGVPQVPLPGVAPAPTASPWDITPDISQQVMGIVSPQLQSAADIINRRGQMGTGAITGLTNAWQSHLSGIGGMLGGWGQGLLKGAAGYGREALTASGQQQAKSLGTALAQAGPGIKGPGDVNLAQEGKGAGGAAYGTGIAALDAMIAKQAAGEARSALEPSFAAMTGQQQQSMLASQLARQLYEQQSQIQASVPELVMNLQNQAYSRQSDLRDYQERVREFNVQQAGQKAQLTGPNAPTLGGRQAYWDKVAADRTSQTGVIYRGTTTGIRPVTDKAGKPVKTSAQVSNQVGLIMATGLDPATGALTPEAQTKLKALGVDTGGGVDTGTVKSNISAATTLEKERTRHQDALAALAIKQQNADTAVGRALISKQVAAERAKHNRWVEQHGQDQPMGPPTGNRPRRTKSGVWTTTSGKPLGPKGQVWWERQFQSGKTDGRGGLGAVNKKTGGGGTVGVIKKKTTP
jgi:hypothetical protein